jgi:hypothetical protein
MANQPRVAKVLAALLVSMTLGAIVLMALGGNPPSAGAFCLSSYYRLDPVEKSILSRTMQTPGRWNRIEIYYSGTKAGNIEQLASINGLSSPDDINCHFVICNGLGGSSGQIMPTTKWQKQWSCIPGKNWYGSGQTVRICVVADSLTSRPTDFQVKRTEAIVEALANKFTIAAQSISYPANWQQ